MRESDETARVCGAEYSRVCPRSVRHISGALKRPNAIDLPPSRPTGEFCDAGGLVAASWYPASSVLAHNFGRMVLARDCGLHKQYRGAVNGSTIVLPPCRPSRGTSIPPKLVVVVISGVMGTRSLQRTVGRGGQDRRQSMTVSKLGRRRKQRNLDFETGSATLRSRQIPPTERRLATSANTAVFAT